MTASAFDDLLRDADEITGSFDLDKLLGGPDRRPKYDLDFDDDLPEDE